MIATALVERAANVGTNGAVILELAAWANIALDVPSHSVIAAPGTLTFVAVVAR
jgi:hypothetical protein